MAYLGVGMNLVEEFVFIGVMGDEFWKRELLQLSWEKGGKFMP